jgi:hypothetical protein
MWFEFGLDKKVLSLSPQCLVGKIGEKVKHKQGKPSESIFLQKKPVDSIDK